MSLVNNPQQGSNAVCHGLIIAFLELPCSTALKAVKHQPINAPCPFLSPGSCARQPPTGAVKPRENCYSEGDTRWGCRAAHLARASSSIPPWPCAKRGNILSSALWQNRGAHYRSTTSGSRFWLADPGEGVISSSTSSSLLVLLFPCSD